MRDKERTHDDVRTVERTIVLTTSIKRRLVRNHHTCVNCQERRARFRFQGIVKADDDHNLCFQCFRAVRNRLRSFRTEVAL